MSHVRSPLPDFQVGDEIVEISAGSAVTEGRPQPRNPFLDRTPHGGFVCSRPLEETDQIRGRLNALCLLLARRDVAERTPLQEQRLALLLLIGQSGNGRRSGLRGKRG